jgi:O-antigen/teichoic acid export membrane protein
MIGNIARTFATRILVMALGTVVSVVASRVLGPAGRGQYAAAVAFAALITQFGNLGLHGSNTYLVGLDRTSFPPLLGNSLLVGLGWGSVLGGVLYLASVTVEQSVVDPELRLLVAVMVPLTLTYMLLQNLAMAVERFDLFNRTEIMNASVTLVLALAIIAAAALTPSQLLGANLAGYVVAGVWVLAALVRRYGIAIRRDLLRRGLRYGWRSYALSVAGFAVSRTDLFVVTSRLGDSAAGYYSVALTLIGLFSTFPAIVGQVLFPRLGTLPTLEERWRQTWRTVSWLGLLVFGGAGCAALLAPLLIRVLFGAPFLDAVVPFRGLLFGAVFMALHVVLVQYLNSLGYPVGVVGLWLFAALLNWGLNLLLVPRLGLIGGAWASGLTSGLLAAGVAAIAWWYGPGTARGRARLAGERA